MKIVTIEEALKVVKTNDVIVFGMCGGEPTTFASNLHKIADDGVTNVTVITCLPQAGRDYFMNEDYLYHFKMKTWFESSTTRKVHKFGRISYIPNHLHFAGTHRSEVLHTNIFVCQVSPPNKEGKVSLGLSNVYESVFMETVDTVIFEVNENIPFVNGDHIYDMNTADYIFYSDSPAPELPLVPISEKDNIIGKLIADEIKDGNCIQVGIGGIPNAICGYLRDKKDLGIHTEMLTTGIVDLLKLGVVTNQKKQTHIGKTVCCFALGNKELYDYIHNNEDVLILNGFNVNEPAVIGENDNQVSINTTIEIDLTGQCCSESLGHVQFSGTGGQTDTAVGAQRSKNGKSYIALYSTAMVRNKETQEREEVSKIVISLKPGAAVSLCRNDVQYVVSEYGMVNLRGLCINERAAALISIAHPKFREELTADAKKYGLL